MTLRSKIFAVKAVWDLVRNQVKPELKLVMIDGKPYYQVAGGKESTIKDCKDLTEAIMRLGVREYLKDPMKFVEYHGDPKTDIHENPIRRALA